MDWSSVLAWRIPGTGEPGGLPSMGSHQVRHDWSDLAAAAENLYDPFRAWHSLRRHEAALVHIFLVSAKEYYVCVHVFFFLVWPSFFTDCDWSYLSSIRHLFLLYSLDCNLSLKDQWPTSLPVFLSQLPCGLRETVILCGQVPYQGRHIHRPYKGPCPLTSYLELSRSREEMCGSREEMAYVVILPSSDCFSDGTSWGK